MLLHSVLFDNTAYNATTAREWLKRHNIVPIKRVDKTKNYLRYRIRECNYIAFISDPSEFKSFVTKKVKNIDFIFGVN